MTQLFREASIETAYQEVRSRIEKAVASTSESTLLNESLETLATTIAKDHMLKPLSILFDKRGSKAFMRKVSGRHFPKTRAVDHAKIYDCASVKYTFPVDGSTLLLKYQPQKRTFTYSLDVDVSGSNFSFDYNTFYGSEELSEELKKEVINYVGPIIDQMKDIENAINTEVHDFNTSTVKYALSRLEDRIIEIKRRRQQDDDLNNF